MTTKLSTIFKMGLMRCVCVLCILCIAFCYGGSADGDERSCLMNPAECLINLSDRLTQVFTNRHIVLVGDSLTRYQYLSLVYALRHQHPLEAKMKPNLVEEKTWDDWPSFYAGSTGLLAPYEVCDCVRPSGPLYFVYTFENRYYHDPKHNISITYFSYLDSIQGRIKVNEQFNPDVIKQYPSNMDTNPAWRYDKYNIDKFFAEHAVQLKPRPDVILLNYGKWRHVLSDAQMTQLVFSVFNAADIFIWKTTTASDPLEMTKEDSEFEVNYDREQSEQIRHFEAITVMNTSWTSGIGGSYYWDGMHFKEPVYSVLNLQLAGLIQQKLEEVPIA